MEFSQLVGWSRGLYGHMEDILFFFCLIKVLLQIKIDL